MRKIDFTILKKKTGPLPNWAWALIASALIYMLYRHFQSAGGDSGGGSPSAMDIPTGDSGSSPAPGDLLGNGSENAGNGPLTASQEWGDRGITSDFQDFMSQLEDQALAERANNDSQGDDTTANDGTDSAAAGLGLTHISGAYWWDPDSHKLIKIPGSGGPTKGSGKKKVPNKNKTAGRKKPVARKKNRITRSKTVRPKAVAIRGKPKPHAQKPKSTKKKVLPKARAKLSPKQRAAINRAHHPTPKRPIYKPPKRKVPRQLPKRPVRRGPH